jgi:3'(2'), 5'-bisphosphate nucleotidase
VLDLQPLLTVARNAARSASAVCLAVLEETPERPEAMSKPGREPVTIADYASQAVILEAVSSAFPGHRVISEEGSDHFRDNAGPDGAAEIERLVRQSLGRPVTLAEILRWIDHTGGDREPTWAIDPIDGTKGFLRRDQFAVAIGLMRDGAAVAGVLGCPNLPVDPSDPGGRRGVLFWGGPGMGAFAEPIAGGTPQPIVVSREADPGAVRVLGSVEAAHGDPALVRSLIDEARIGGDMVRIDSQAKYGAVAAGWAEVYVRPRKRAEYREKVWDHAAGAAVVAGAGGRVTDLDGAELDFSLGSRLEENRGIVASNGLVHEIVLEGLRRAETRGPKAG